MDFEGSPPATARAVNKRVYVALGSDVRESRLTLLWALANFRDDFRIIHVLSPPPDGSGGSYPVPRVSGIHSMEETLSEYVRICDQANVHYLAYILEFNKTKNIYTTLGVPVEKRWVEMRDVAKGIVELIEQHAVEKLVMGAAADKHYTEGMTELKSTKAKFVQQHAHPSCHIWFICKGNLIQSREGDLSTIDMDVTSSWRPARSASEPVQSDPRSPSLGSVHSTSDSSEVEDYVPLVRHERGEASADTPRSSLISSYEEDRQLALLPVLEGNGNDELYEQLERAMTEAANAKREAYEELLRRQKAERNAIEASRRAKMLENLYSEELQRRRELEVALAKEKEDFEAFKNGNAEDVSAACDQRTFLEAQIASANHMMRELQEKVASTKELLEVCKKERDELQEHLENALKVNEELLTNQAEAPSTSHRQPPVTEFSFSEIQEATDNFDPASKLEEGGWGSIYKGSLRHTPVTIKMLHPDSSEGPSQYHREVEVVSKLRHPNLVALIGVCPDAWALIYEHLPNGCLEARLSSENNSNPLSWQDRMRICTEICSALIFLHSSSPNSTVHGDLNAKNVLLDANSVSKLKDLRIHDRNSSPRTLEDGTDSSRELSVESDIYSFGIILLQLLTGKSVPNSAAELQDALDEGSINDMLDQTAGDWPFLETTQLVHLALSCCEVDRRHRPDLSLEVWDVLESIRASCEASANTPSQTSSADPHEPPSYLLCPINQELMEDPHVAADGFTYEATAIRGWLNGGHDTSPMTNLQLANTHLVPNRAIRSAIEEWGQNH